MPVSPYSRYLSRIRRQQRSLPCIILHFDPARQDLGTWFWYVTHAAVNFENLTNIRPLLEGLLTRQECTFTLRSLSTIAPFMNLGGHAAFVLAMAETAIPNLLFTWP
jgi:hypothetical protein